MGCRRRALGLASANTGSTSNLFKANRHSSEDLLSQAIPQQVWIDGIPQLSGSASLQKPDSLQAAPHTPNFAKEADLAVRYDGLPPLDSGSRILTRPVVFTNVKELWVKSSSGEIISNFTAEPGLVKIDAKTSLQTVVVENGEITCVSGFSSNSCVDKISSPDTQVLDLAGGSISPALTSYGSELGLVDIALDMTTGDGNVHDPVGAASTNSLLEGIEVRAADGLIFASRNALYVTSIPIRESPKMPILNHYTRLGSRIGPVSPPLSQLLCRVVSSTA